jgi:hypothetical protein
LANWQLADAAGIFLGFMVNLIIVSYVHNHYQGWRILTNTVLIPTIPLLIMIYLMPESPRYLMKHGKYRRALEAFTMIQTTPLLASRDFMYAHAQLDFESRLLKGDANEEGLLADRIGHNNNELTGQIRPRALQAGSETAISVSSTQSVSGANPHRPEDIQLSSLARADSDASSLDSEIGVRRVGAKENPYFYHIGVTGYFKRLVELWRNKRCRRALFSASIAMISQQMVRKLRSIGLCGIFY